MIRSTVYFDRIPNAVVNNESINNQEEPDEFERALDAFINSELELLKDNDEYEFGSVLIMFPTHRQILPRKMPKSHSSPRHFHALSDSRLLRKS